jgi:hypothetical protein
MRAATLMECFVECFGEERDMLAPGIAFLARTVAVDTPTPAECWSRNHRPPRVKGEATIHDTPGHQEVKKASETARAI